MRFKSIMEAGINLILSLVFITKFNMGLMAVLLGTLLSTVLVDLWWEPLVLFKYGFKSSLGTFFMKFSKYLIVAIVTQIIIFNFLNTFYFAKLWQIILIAGASLIFYFVIYTLLFFKTSENQYFIHLFVDKIIKPRQKNH